MLFWFDVDVVDVDVVVHVVHGVGAVVHVDVDVIVDAVDDAVVVAFALYRYFTLRPLAHPRSVRSD